MGLPGPITEAQERQLRLIQGSGRHLLSLINDLLDLAKIESGKVDLHLEPLTCQAVIEDVTAPLVVRGDRRMVSQILVNLVNNAIKFTAEGTVSVALEPREAPGGPSLAIHVTDCGIGIREEDQAKLFDAFRQVGGTAAPTQEGSGLGL